MILDKIKYIIEIFTILILVTSCKQEAKYPKEVKVYYDTGELKTIGFMSKDSLPIGLYKSFYKTGEVYSEVTFLKGKMNGKYKEYYENGQVKLISEYENDLKSGNEKKYYNNGVLEGAVTYENDKIIDDVIIYNNKSQFEMYQRYNKNIGILYVLEKTKNIIQFKEIGRKFVNVGSNILVENKQIALKELDLLRIELDVANPPSCKEVIYTRLNGVTKDSATVSSIKYDYKLLPTKLGENKLEIFIDYYCADYKLKSDYFTTNFNVVKDSVN